MVCAPNAYKGALSAPLAAAAMARGVRAAGLAAIELPVADGGDGTLEVLLATSPTSYSEMVSVIGPLGDRVDARLGWMGGSHERAVVELADASGLRLVSPGGLDALRASSRGTGELIVAALDRGARQITVGVGGSASTDGGAGALCALGLALADAGGSPLPDGGGALVDLDHVDASRLDPRLRHTQIELAVDVEAPLLGERGAAAVFAPQKGATPSDIAVLEAGLARLANVLEQGLGVDTRLRQAAGVGACGGFTYGMAAVGARIVPGAALVCDLVGFDRALLAASLVLTGEGRLDPSTAAGKAPREVAQRARRAGIPCIVLAGTVTGDVGEDFAAVEVLGDGLGAEESMRRTAELLETAAERVVRRALVSGAIGDQ